MSSLIATINRDRARADEGNKSARHGTTRGARFWSVQAVPDQADDLSRMYPASRPGMTVTASENRLSGRRGPSALSLPL
jgi:hypothetical protein